MQARKPVALADARVSWNWTFFGFGILEGHDVVILEKLWGHESATLPTRVGGRMPAHCTAAGKALLAFAPEKAVEEVIAGGLERCEADFPYGMRVADRLRREPDDADRSQPALRAHRDDAAPLAGRGVDVPTRRHR